MTEAEIVNGLENMRRCFRSGMFGQREVWERQLEAAAAALAAANAEIAKLREIAKCPSDAGYTVKECNERQTCGCSLSGEER